MTMILEIPRDEILNLLYKQLNSFFSCSENEKSILNTYLDRTLVRCEVCFLGINNKYWTLLRGGVKFNPFHSIQYMTFLYFLANEIYRNTGTSQLTDKLYYLNKLLNGLDMYYAIELPEVWSAEHPVGSVLGRARYGNNFFFYQCCTVGGNHGIYPRIGENVKMFAHSQILGDCNIGNNVKIGAGCLIKDENIPDNSIVFGQSPNLIIKRKKI